MAKKTTIDDYKNRLDSPIGIKIISKPKKSKAGSKSRTAKKKK